MAPAGKTTIPQKILNVTASLARRRNVKVSRQKVATLCGYPKQEKSFTNALGMLQNKKFQIIYGKEVIEVTEAGYDLADLSAPVGTNKDALEQAKTKIKSSKARQILDILFDGRTHARSKAAKEIGSDATKKSFGNLVGPLKSLDFIEYVTTSSGEKAFRMTDALFPFGRPDEEE